jgi:hypothetical protein
MAKRLLEEAGAQECDQPTAARRTRRQQQSQEEHDQHLQIKRIRRQLSRQQGAAHSSHVATGGYGYLGQLLMPYSIGSTNNNMTNSYCMVCDIQSLHDIQSLTLVSKWYICCIHALFDQNGPCQYTSLINLNNGGILHKKLKKRTLNIGYCVYW